MEKNLSEKIMVTRGTQGNVNENSTKTNNIKSKRAPETKLGKLYEELVIAKHGEEEAKRLLDRDTMNDTIRNMVEKIDVNDPKIEEKKQEIRNTLKLVMIYDLAYDITKEAKRLESEENSFKDLCNEGTFIIDETIDKLPIEYNEETQKMCLRKIGKPKKNDLVTSLNEDCTVIENLHNYLSKSVLKINTYVKNSMNKGLTNRQGTIQEEVRKSEGQYEIRKSKGQYEVHFYTKHEQMEYVESQLNKKITQAEERNGKKYKKVTIKEVEEVMCHNTLEISLYETSSNSDDSRELIETLNVEETRFEDNLINSMDRRSMGLDMTTIIETIIKSLYEQAVKSVRNGRVKASVEDTFELNVALYNVSGIKGNKEFIYYMKKALPTFEDIIKKYGETYEEIAKHQNTTTQAMNEQGLRRERIVKEKLEPIYQKLKKLL
jgi:hypothetical protein